MVLECGSMSATTVPMPDFFWNCCAMVTMNGRYTMSGVGR